MLTVEETKLRQAVLRGAQHMVDNGLGDWTLKLSNKRTTLADCNNRSKTIRYSKHFIKVADKDQFDGVAFHEITHALLPYGEGHGPAFVKKCVEISPNADYAKRSASIPLWKFTTTCPSCKIKGGANRKRKGICKPCYENGKAIRVVYEENKLLVTEW